MYVEQLADQLSIETVTGKIALAAICFITLERNDYYAVQENRKAVLDALSRDLCKRYTLEVYILAGYNGRKLLELMYDYERPESDPFNIYKDYIFPYLRKHIVVPGVWLPGRISMRD